MACFGSASARPGGAEDGGAAPQQLRHRRRLQIHHRHGHRGRPGWRWVVLFARFLASFLALGAFKSMGVFLPHFVNSFSTSTAVAGVVAVSSLSFGQAVASPFGGALLKLWQPRCLTIVGGLVAASCCVAASFSSTITQLAVWYLVSSCGLGLISISVVKPIMEYFPDDFAFANGVSFSGGTVGMMVLPPVMEWLVSVYGWKNALGLLGALQFNYVVVGALLRPMAASTLYRPLIIRDDDDDGQSAYADDDDEHYARNRSVKVWTTVLAFLGEHFDVQVLADPLFLIHQLAFLLSGVLFSAWHVFLIPHCLALGYGEAPSAYLAVFGGLGALVGRLGHGPLIDRGLLSASGLFVLSCLVFAASSLLDPLAVSSYAALAALASLSGLAMGFISALIYVMMREITGDGHMSAFSWLFVSSGVGSLAGGLVGGWIRDVFGDFETVFVTIGVISLVVAVIVTSARCSSAVGADVTSGQTSAGPGESAAAYADGPSSSDSDSEF